MAFRDRFFTPQTARAITAPSAMLLAGAGASLGIIAGVPAAGAATIAAALYVVRVLFAMPREKKVDIDPSVLRDPWRRFVKEALDAQVRYGRAVRTASAGPLRERLTEIGSRIEDGVHECWRIALRGQQLEDALRQLPHPDHVRKELAQVESDRSAYGSHPQLDATVEALRAQIESTERIAAVARGASDQLRLLDARMDESVARAVELALRAGDPDDLGGLGSEVESLVSEMEALRLALEETSGAPTPSNLSRGASG